MDAAVNWAIVGLGAMARTFASDLAAAGDGGRLHAVVSTSHDRAVAFAEATGAAVAYGSLADLLADRGVDVVYVATSHDRHVPVARAAIGAGLPVLVEKPFGLASEEVAAVLEEARRRRVLAMEAMWTLCLPVYRQVRTWLDEGLIGVPRQVSARFCFRGVGGDVSPSLRDPAAGGGSLLDVGVYPIALAQLVFGDEPEHVAAAGNCVGGVDEHVGAVLRFAGGGLAVIASAIEVDTGSTATIEGTAGRITIPDFWRASTATLETAAGDRTASAPLIGGGWSHEVLHVHELLRAGRTVSPLVTHHGSVARARICEAILREVRAGAM